MTLTNASRLPIRFLVKDPDAADAFVIVKPGEAVTFPPTSDLWVRNWDD